MKERPILFGGPMVRSIRLDLKTQTRRVLTKQPPATVTDIIRCGPEFVSAYPNRSATRAYEFSAQCRYGQVGDRLWVRETWADTNGDNGPMISYRAGGDRFLVDESYPVDYSRYPNCTFAMWGGDLRRGSPDHSWRSPIHMPRWASRITLELTDICAERLQSITPDDAKAEGLWTLTKDDGRTFKFGIPDRDGWPGNDNDGWHWQEWEQDPREAYRKLWDSINAKRGFSWATNPWVWALTFKRVEA